MLQNNTGFARGGPMFKPIFIFYTPWRYLLRLIAFSEIQPDNFRYPFKNTVIWQDVKRNAY